MGLTVSISTPLVWEEGSCEGEMSVYQATWHHILDLCTHHYENFKPEMKRANFEVTQYVILSSLLLFFCVFSPYILILFCLFLTLCCRIIAVRCEPQTGVQVAIAQSPRKDFFPGQLVKERKWENLGGSFKEVRWDKMEGKNFLNKMELLMSSLTSSQWATYKSHFDQEQMLLEKISL